MERSKAEAQYAALAENAFCTCARVLRYDGTRGSRSSSKAPALQSLVVSIDTSS